MPTGFYFNLPMCDIYDKYNTSKTNNILLSTKLNTNIVYL